MVGCAFRHSSATQHSWWCKFSTILRVSVIQLLICHLQSGGLAEAKPLDIPLVQPSVGPSCGWPSRWVMWGQTRRKSGIRQPSPAATPNEKARALPACERGATKLLWLCCSGNDVRFHPLLLKMPGRTSCQGLISGPEVILRSLSHGTCLCIQHGGMAPKLGAPSSTKGAKHCGRQCQCMSGPCALWQEVHPLHTHIGTVLRTAQKLWLLHCLI